MRTDPTTLLPITGTSNRKPLWMVCLGDRCCLVFADFKEWARDEGHDLLVGCRGLKTDPNTEVVQIEDKWGAEV